MDKGFNDDELADIMNEIESLEQEFTEEVETVTATEQPTAETPTEEPVVETPVDIDSEMEAVLSELSDMPVEEVSGETINAHDDNVVSLHEVNTPNETQSTATAGSGHSQMSFSVEGDMKLDLSFNVSGKIVHLSINEDGFEIELDGGMKFSIPLDEQSIKKAA